MSVYTPPYGIVVTVDRFAPGFWTDFVNAANRSLSVGDQVTSWWRSHSANIEAGGEGDSQHLIGTAFDVVSEDRTLAQRLRAAGFIVVEYPTHLHAQAWPAGIARASGLLGFLGL